MTPLISYRPVDAAQQRALVDNGCYCDDWSSVEVDSGFDARRVRRTRLVGAIRLGRDTEIDNATLGDCTVGCGVRITNVGVRIANYDIGDGACIEDVGLLETRPGATFGNGVDVEVLNEGGGREVILFNELSAQFAHLMCLHRYRPKLIDKLSAIARQCADAARGDTGSIGLGATVRSVAEMVDVCVGPGATIAGAARLVNGTILSELDAPTTVGAAVHAEDFIIAEGSVVDSGALLGKTFVGQSCRIGKQFSAENSLFFANCEGFHGEAVCVFAGPYTVTHHKSTLLIAGLFSFYNAGSGTNQSNHMYKLGPIHEGKLERGSKTGSFSYMMWPCRVGPFSVVLGKHTRSFDTSNLPFSLINAGVDGRCHVVPGLNLATVGTVRDGAKWPSRDRRKGAILRDHISFDVFSPYTVGRMIRGSDILSDLADNTDIKVDTVSIHGAEVKRVLLRKSLRFYRVGIEMYLLDKVFCRAERAIASDFGLAESFTVDDEAVYSDDWVDLGGLLLPRGRLETLTAAIESGHLTPIDAFSAELDRIAAAYDKDEWAWVRRSYQRVFDRDLDQVTDDDLVAVADALLDVRGKFLKHILGDAQKEFDALARTGFGQDGVGDDADADFAQVRGTYESNNFVEQMQDELTTLAQRVAIFKRNLAAV